MNLDKFKTVGLFPKGILSLESVAALFPEADIKHLSLLKRKKVDVSVGWGQKASGQLAEQFARQKNIPCLRLEDGFLRSLAPGWMTPDSVSMIVDDVGMYFDPQKPSRLENILNDDSNFSDDKRQKAQEGIELLKKFRLSKYNHATDVLPENFLKSDRRKVLVVDQVYGDLSVIYSGENRNDFRQMLQMAIDENHEAEIWVKLHPEVSFNFRNGYFPEILKSFGDRVQVLEGDVNPWVLFEQIDSVYTVSSLLGFEALLAGKEVKCFGLPFYAGWGLTQDQKRISRRKKSRTVQEIFSAAYLEYSVYINPFTKKMCSFEEAVEILNFWKEINAFNRQYKHFVGFPKKKQTRVFQAFGSSDLDIEFHRHFKSALKAKEKDLKKIVSHEFVETNEDYLLVVDGPFQESMAMNPARLDLKQAVDQGEFSEEHLLRAEQLWKKICDIGLKENYIYQLEHDAGEMGLNEEDLKKSRYFNAMVFLMFIKDVRCYDPKTNIWCEPEVLLERLNEMKE